MKKLRLLITEKCHRNCPGCCNNDWDLDALPVFDLRNSGQYKEILITGGEPMLNHQLVIDTTLRIKGWANIPIYVYTAKVDKYDDVFDTLKYIDGMTITIHENSDVVPFVNFATRISDRFFSEKSFRVNIFKGVEHMLLPRDANIWDLWTPKWDMEWIKNCPLPEDEEFMRL